VLIRSWPCESDRRGPNNGLPACSPDHNRDATELSGTTLQIARPQPKSACSIRVSIPACLRFWRIWRKGRSAKFFAINNWKQSESHPLRQIASLGHLTGSPSPGTPRSPAGLGERARVPLTSEPSLRSVRRPTPTPSLALGSLHRLARLARPVELRVRAGVVVPAFRRAVIRGRP